MILFRFAVGISFTRLISRVRTGWFSCLDQY